MPMHIQKWERREGVDRDKFAQAALNVCRHARSLDGVRDARFYWANADTIGLAVLAEAGAWGQNSTAAVDPAGAKALFGLSDISRQTVSELWGDAGAGEQAFRMSR